MRTLITGASAGLGAEMARQFADLGHDLVLTARRVERLEQLRDEIVAAYGRGDHVAGEKFIGDMSHADMVGVMVRLALEVARWRRVER